MCPLSSPLLLHLLLASPSSSSQRITETKLMANPSEQVSLPQSVEQLLAQICESQNLTQPNSDVRRALADLGERDAVQLLTRISKYTIKNLSQYLLRSIQNASSDRSPKRTTACVSAHSTPGSATRLMHSQDISSSPVAVHPQSSPRINPEQAQGLSPELRKALGELEFRKAFLLLNYIGGKSLENAVMVDEIRSWKNLTMEKFESEACRALKRNGIHVKDRIKSLEWDSGKAHVYYCHVSLDGNLSFKGPYLQNIRRSHLQRSLGDENVLIVKFAEEDNESGLRISSWQNAVYRNFGREGILLGLRRYHFFVFKDGGKEEKSKDPTASSVKCYFVRIESDAFIDMRGSYILANKTVSEARSLFMHVHLLPNVANYMARFSLILSKTLKLNVDLATVDIQTIDDVYCLDEYGNAINNNGRPRIHTDGTGFISEDLALLCPKNVFKGSCTNNEAVKAIRLDNEHGDVTIAMTPSEFHTQEPPLLIQCRLFNDGCAIKGTLLVNKKLPQRTIQVRPSMIKVMTDSNISNIQTINSLEVVNTSNKPKKTYLSKYLIVLLSYGGVPENFFMNLLETALEDTRGVFSSKRAALKVLINHGELDDFNSARMILTGIPLEEPYLQYHLAILARKEMRGLGGGKLHIPDSYYVMGTADPTGCLQPNQVCIVLENGQISGTVLVYRNPGLHFGDIHVLEATYVKELESYVGNSKYAIFFPCIGPRNLADEIAGGDFDGDMYWVSRNPQLLEYFKKSDPWMPSSSDCSATSVNKCEPKRPSEFSAVELEDELFELYLTTRFHPSNAKGVAADSWLAMMDRLLTLGNDCIQEKECLKKKMLRLIDIYYEALDAPKKGGRKVEVPSDLRLELFPHYMERNNSFTSNSILGSIYDKVNLYQEQYMPVIEIRKLPCFDSEIPESIRKKWEKRYSKYRRNMAKALNQDPEGKDEAAEDVIRKYKDKLYGTEESPMTIEDICNEAIAIYNIVYDFAESQGKVKYCHFAWKVAGSTLLNIFQSKQGERTLTCVPSVLREIFG